MTDGAADWVDQQAAFKAAASWFTEVVAYVSDTWDDPGLGAWTVRDLVGHTSRALSTVDSYLDLPANDATLHSAADYFLRVFPATGDQNAVVRRGRDAGRALPDASAMGRSRLLPRLPPHGDCSASSPSIDSSRASRCWRSRAAADCPKVSAFSPTTDASS